MPQAQLVLVATEGENVHLIELQRADRIDIDPTQADHLPCDPLAVLESGVPEITRWATELMTEDANGLHGGEISLLYPQIDMLTLSAGLIKWHLLYEKIVKLLTNAPTDPWIF